MSAPLLPYTNLSAAPPDRHPLPQGTPGSERPPGREAKTIAAPAAGTPPLAGIPGPIVVIKGEKTTDTEMDGESLT